MRIELKIQKAIEEAIITLPNKGGCGVLVNGNIIVTAAHCVQINLSGEMAILDQSLDTIDTRHQGTIKAKILFVELVNDIALLGAADYQDSYSDCEKYKEYCNHTKAIQICSDDFETRKEYEAYVSYRGKLIKIKHQKMNAKAQRHWFESEEIIEPGMSGSPIVNPKGELIGVISHSSFDTDNKNGKFPRITTTLTDHFQNKLE